MKLNRRITRILILSLLIVSVFVPIFLLSGTVKNLHSGVPDGFIEDLSSNKNRKDALKSNVIEMEGGQSLKEPPLIVYKDEDLSSMVSYSSEINDRSNVSLDAENSTDILDGKVTKQGTEQNQKNQTVVLPTASREELLTRTTLKHNESNNSGQNKQSGSRKLVDEKVKQMKDQVIRAQMYLAFTSPKSTSSLMRELKQRIKQVEHAIGGSTKDSDLHRSATLKMRLMEATLSKASRIFTDCNSMSTKLRAMTYNAEEQVRAHKNQVSYLIQLAGRTTPKGLHCLSMRLTAQYFTLQPEERYFPNQHRVHDPDLYHFAVFSDNILACSVVIYSTIAASKVPEKLVFHVVTDSVNLPSMSMWLLLNTPKNSTINIQNIDTFTWLSSKYGVVLQKENSHDPIYTSALNHLRFYLPDVFPTLNKIVFLDHDVVVLRDLTRLWSVDMKGKVNGAVETCQEDEPSFRRMDMFINVSDPYLEKYFDPKACTWAFGLNIFDLREWRRQNLTGVYHKYLHLGETREIWKAGSLPLGWLTFYNNTVGLKRSWHILGLGYESGVSKNEIDKAVVIHYNGVMKPWLDIGLDKYKSYWRRHVNYDHPFLQQCNIHP
ncbi:probable galacturonosyltransferase 6 [Impatiens glandulifera]|uniref:probable galacturonosyltransferase 6 n=1 Tax=Impatiens glandulifera TaxID=253017 RepID=UPI001FB0A593|nr:probable galacturonosyltransferase 6 [Impatiens glandulifera]